MKKFILGCILVALTCQLNAQSEVYSVTSGELIFGMGDVERQVDGAVTNINSNLRFTVFFHVGQYLHYDFSNNVGMYSGMAIRNVGFITQDRALDLEKEVHRVYTLGVPLAIKIGNFDDHFYMFGGAEYELAFNYKYKWWQDGTKYKTSEWFSDRSNLLLPSVFAGVQFPGGVNLKVKYYLTDLLNHDYKKGTDSRNDYTDYQKSQMFHVSLCWQFNTKEFKRIFESDFYETALK